MSRVRIAPIVEGHGEQGAVRTLLYRVWTELLGGEHAEVLQPIREQRKRIVREEELKRAIGLAVAKLAVGASADPAVVLVLLDADTDAPCILGPELLAKAETLRADADVTCVIANVEYETWFVAAAESLGDYLELAEGEAVPDRPEEQRCGKGWVERHFSRTKGARYSETVDQPRMTARMDLARCRQRSPSFDKLCRELEKRLRAGGSS